VCMCGRVCVCVCMGMWECGCLCGCMCMGPVCLWAVVGVSEWMSQSLWVDVYFGMCGSVCVWVAGMSG
jgi:hypothetical protein